MLKANFRFGLPTNECNYLKSSSTPNSELIYEIINKPLHGKLVQWNPRFPLILMRTSSEFGKMYNLSSENMFPIYLIRDKKDVDFLIHLADKLDTKANSGEIKPRIFLDGVFLDGCRWCQEICPALKLRRVVINECEEILPCLTGQPLGNIYNDVQDLRSHARKIYAQLREERKCGKCPADLRCSKCIFPYPLNQEEYCELQRTNLNISGIVTRSNLVNTEDFS
jgi:hypothetical protein